VRIISSTGAHSHVYVDKVNKTNALFAHPNFLREWPFSFSSVREISTVFFNSIFSPQSIYSTGESKTIKMIIEAVRRTDENATGQHVREKAGMKMDETVETDKGTIEQYLRSLYPCTIDNHEFLSTQHLGRHGN
jgi:hypothetical protein